LSSQDEASRREELERRVREYHGVSTAEVLELVSYLRDEGDSVIAGGSLALRLGNHLSDLDILIAGDTTVESSRVPLEHFVKTLRVDVWKLEQRLIEETFDRAETALGAPEPLHGSFGDVDHETDLKLLHRIAFGVTLDGPGLEASATRDYKTIAADLVVREYAERLHASAFLAQVAARMGRPIAASINARLAVEEALNAVIANRRIPFTGDKWLRERLASDTQDLAPAYAPFATLPEAPGDVPAFVERAVAACSELTGRDLSLATLRREAGWSFGGLEAAKVGEQDMLLAVDVGGLWQLEPDEAAAWERIVQRGADTGEGVWRAERCDEEELRLCLRLHEEGVASLRWARGVPARELTLEQAVSA
jgi:hypothetical protein